MVFEQLLTWNALGLLLDILGATALGAALIRQSDSHILAKAVGDFTFDEALAREACEQRIDARVGSSYLLLGFSLQLIAPLLQNRQETIWGLAVAATLGMLIYWVAVRRIVVENNVATVRLGFATRLPSE